MCKNDRRTVSGVLSLVLILALGAPVFGQRLVTVPVGTVVPLRMDTFLSSNSSHVADRFTATVFRPMLADGLVMVPEGAKVEGHVTAINPGERGRGPGAIAVTFDRIVFPSGNSIPIDATLTTLNEEGRRRIEQDVRFQASGQARRAVVFLGPGTGTGLIIGVAGGGGETTTVGSILGTLLGAGGRAEVQTGTEFGLMVERSFRVDTDTTLAAEVGGLPGQAVFASPESIRFAQITLRDRGYYTGPINGIMSQATSNAIRQFQHDRNVTLSGELDLRTARELGIASEAGIESAAIEVVNPRAERISPSSIRISGDVHTQGSGWQIFVNRFVGGDTLHVYVRAVPPQYPAGSAIDHHPFTQTYNDLPNVARVIIHGPQRDFTADLLRGGGGTLGATGFGNPPQIALLTSRLLQDFQRQRNMRNNSGQVIFDTRRDFRPNEVELLSQIVSLQASAELYSQLTASITDRDAIQSAAVGLMRQARFLERIMRREPQIALSPLVRADWEQLQAELARIKLPDINTENDIIR